MVLAHELRCGRLSLSYTSQGESVPAVYTRILRAIGRQQAIIKAKAGPKPAVNGSVVEPETEHELKDKRIPLGSMLDDTVSFSVQAAVWEMIGRFPLHRSNPTLVN
jgi:hypothetical protein